MHQFTFVGSPHIWNGDEMGMTGADDPDNRKPLTWPDINFEPETQSDFSDYTYSEQPVFNASVFQFYQSIIKLRCSSKAFSNGNYEFENISDENNILAYYRSSDDEKFLIIFNNNENKTSIRLPINIVGYEVVFAYRFIKKESGKLIDFPPYSAVVFKITE
ncbi:MAG: alpha-glucosidase C-terminal domain-containing protein [Saprospiraceae bacterium]|nr:alpha-glucosidase C-terminal domain-containing protein [Saprospiraceae bacterium]